jgi:hypothetical protein
MAHAAVVEGATNYQPRHYAVRSRLYAGLNAGTLHVGPLVHEERLKLVLPVACCYCGATEGLTADHVIPKHRGGPDTGDNLIWACRSCNSAKRATDMLAWLEQRGEFPPLLLLRRYLKLGLEIYAALEALERFPEDVRNSPLDLARVPRKYPTPDMLRLWVVPF